MTASEALSAGERRTSPAGWRVLAILSALMGFASISTDLYLPAMPAMGQALGAHEGLVAWTVSGYLIVFSVGQLGWGLIGDRFGRRLPVAAGMVLFVVGSAGCALAGSISAVIAWRIVQALGAAASVVLGRSMVRDLYEGHRAAQMMSTLMSVMAIAPLLGPLIDGQVLALGGWRSIFWTLVGVGIATLLAVFTLPETLPDESRGEMPLRNALKRFGELIGDQRLLGYAGVGGFFYAGMFAYIAGTPFAYIYYYGVPEQLYGLLFGVGVIGIIAANLINARLVERFDSDQLMLWGAFGAALSAVIVALNTATRFGGLAGLAIPLFAFIAMTGFIVANSIAGALADFPERAGAVSALVGACQYGSGIIGSALVGAFANGTPAPMGWIIAVAGIGSAACAVLVSTLNKPSLASLQSDDVLR